MNAVAVIYVNSHLADLQAEAQQPPSGLAGREAQPPGAPRLRCRRPPQILGSDSGPVVPQLKNYPYGG